MSKKKTWEGLLLMVLGKFPPNELPPGRFPPTLTLIQGDICLEGNLLGGGILRGTIFRSRLLIINIYFRYCEEKSTGLTDVKIHNIKVNQSKRENEYGCKNYVNLIQRS